MPAACRVPGSFTAGRESLVGDRFLGRVLKIDRGVDAAFVDIGEPKRGFLPLAASPSPPVEGQIVTVEVSRDPVAGKGARLNGRIGEAVVLPPGSRPPLRLSAGRAVAPASHPVGRRA